MRPEGHVKMTLDKIDGYLAGSLSPADVSEWALSVMVSQEWDALASPITEAIHALFDLHDRGEEWAPTREELLRYRRLLVEYRQKVLSDRTTMEA